MSNDNLFDDILNDDIEIELDNELTAKIDDVFNDMPSINDRAMISVLKRRDTRMTSVYDEATQDELREAIGDNSLTANKRLFKHEDSPVRELIRLSNALYRFHNQHTLESGTIGERVLDLQPRKGEHVLVEFRRAIDERISQIMEKARNDLYPRWDDIVQQDIDFRSEVAKADPDPSSRARKLSRISVHEYPTADEMLNQFSISWDLKAISDESAIARLTRGPAEILEKARSDVQRIIAGVQHSVKQDLAERMLSPITRAVAKLEVPIGEKGSVFRDSLIDNLKEQLDHISNLCIIDDPDTHAAIAKARAVIDQTLPTHEALRTSQDARDKALNQLNDLAKTFNGLR